MSVKKLLYGVLQDALGDYIEGLQPESLKLGLWSGKIELQDLRVNTKAVDELSLPVRIETGTVGKLSVAIPWSSLGSTPVRIAIDKQHHPSLRNAASTSQLPYSQRFRAKKARADALPTALV